MKKLHLNQFFFPSIIVVSPGPVFADFDRLSKIGRYTCN